MISSTANTDAQFVAAVYFGPLHSCATNESSTCEETVRLAKDLVITLTMLLGGVDKPTLKAYKVMADKNGGHYFSESKGDLPWELTTESLISTQKFWLENRIEANATESDSGTTYQYLALTYDEPTGTLYLAAKENGAQATIYHKKLDKENQFGEWNRVEVDKEYGGLVDYNGKLYGLSEGKVYALSKSTLSPTDETLSIKQFFGCDENLKPSFDFGQGINENITIGELETTPARNPSPGDNTDNNQSPVTQTTPPSPKSNSDWIIWLIVVLVIVAVIVIIAVCLFCCKKSSDQGEDKPKSGPDSKIASESEAAKGKETAGTVKSHGSQDSKTLGAVDSKESKKSDKDSEVSSVRSGVV